MIGLRRLMRLLLFGSVLLAIACSRGDGSPPDEAAPEDMAAPESGEGAITAEGTEFAQPTIPLADSVPPPAERSPTEV